jgi:hypothetical protein
MSAASLKHALDGESSRLHGPTALHPGERSSLYPSGRSLRDTTIILDEVPVQKKNIYC